MTKKILFLFLAFLFQGCLNKENKKIENNIVKSKKESVLIKDSDETQIKVVKNFMKWYIENMNILYQFNTIDGGPMSVKENEEAENYFVNFTEVEKYIVELKKSCFLSDNFLQEKRQTFIDGDKYFKENPENDGPPIGFDYDPFFLTQDVFEEDLPNIEKTKYTVRQNDKFNSEVEFYLPIPDIKYRYTLKLIDSKWVIEKIESIKK